MFVYDASCSTLHAMLSFTGLSKVSDLLICIYFVILKKKTEVRGFNERDNSQLTTLILSSSVKPVTQDFFFFLNTVFTTLKLDVIKERLGNVTCNAECDMTCATKTKTGSLIFHFEDVKTDHFKTCVKQWCYKD